jgi:tetratricopeptide (TPR) repeat protein
MDIPDGADMKLLFSDGLDNFSVKKFSPKSPLYAFISSPGSDINSLRRLAEKSGGALIDLTVFDIETALEYMNYRAETFSFDGNASDVTWNISGGLLKISGIVNDKKTPISVTVNNEKSVLNYEENEYTLVPSIWATMRVSELEAEYDINKAEIRRIGKAFGLVTRGTSLIVLEQAMDYLQNDIDPPAELKSEYDKLSVTYRPRQNKEQNKIERVVREWVDRELWWNKDFSKDPIPKIKSDARPQDMDLGMPEIQAYERRNALSAVGVMLFGMGAPAARAPSFLADQERLDENKALSDKEFTSAKITIRQWTSDAPYITRMKEAAVDQIYRIYIDERPDYENSPAFYLDVAFQLAEKGQEDLAFRVLSNLAEMNLENRQILRVLGYRLMQIGKSEFAVVIFKKVLEIGEEEPQSYRDLGLAYDAIGEYQRAVDSFYSVVEKSFSRNFPGIEVIALTEMNKVIALAPVEINTKHIDPRLIKNMPLDLRVILVWDSDLTDIDLHVADPNGEEAFYGHPLTYQGGRMSPDNTTGYGPEEYSLKKAKPGKYTVHVNFYGHTQQAISESTTIQLDFYTAYGTKEQEKQSVTMRLKERNDRIFVGEFAVK